MFTLWFFILLYIGSTTTLQNFLQSQNVLFKHHANIHTSAHIYTIGFPLDIQHLLIQSAKLKGEYENFLNDFNELDPVTVVSDASHVVQYAQLLKFEHRLATHLQLDIDFQHDRLKNISKLCGTRCSRRRRRSVLPFVGEILQTLFGISTENNLADISHDIVNLRDTQESIIHNIQHSYSVINTTMIAVAENRLAINDIFNVANDLQYTLANMTERQLKEYQNIATFKLLSTRYDQLCSARETYHAYFFYIKGEIDNLELKLESLLSNHVTPNILSPNTLKETLINIKYKLPATLTLPYDINTELYKYYTIMFARAYPEPYGFQVNIKLPLYDSTSSFNIYEILHIPIFLKYHDTYVNSTARYITDQKYIAISHDSNRIIFLNENSIQTCLNQHLHFCLISDVTYYLPMLKTNCIIALYLSKSTVPELCPSVMKPTSFQHPQAIWINLNLWAISTPIPTHFQILCHNSSYTMTIDPPFGMLRLNPGCKAASDIISIPNQIPKHLNIGIDEPIINITSLHLIWGPITNQLDNQSSIQIQTLHQMKAFHQEMSIPEFKKNVILSSANHTTHHNWFGLTALIICGSSIIITLIIVSLYKLIKKHPLSLYRRPAENIYVPMDTLAASAPATEESHCCEGD